MESFNSLTDEESTILSDQLLQQLKNLASFDNIEKIRLPGKEIQFDSLNRYLEHLSQQRKNSLNGLHQMQSAASYNNNNNQFGSNYSHSGSNNNNNNKSFGSNNNNHTNNSSFENFNSENNNSQTSNNNQNQVFANLNSLRQQMANRQKLQEKYNQTHSKTINHVLQLIDNHKRVYQQLKNNNNTNNNNINNLNNNWNNGFSRLNEYQRMTNNLQQQIDSLQEERNQYVENYKTTAEQIQDLRNKLRKLLVSRGNKNRNNNIDSSSSSLDDLTQLIDSQITHLHSNLNNYTKIIEKQQQKIQDLEAHVARDANAKPHIDALKQQHQEQISKYHEIRKQIQEWQKTREKILLSSANNNNNNSNENLVSFMDSQIKELDFHLDGYRQSMNHKIKRIESLSNSHSELDSKTKQEIESLREQLETQSKAYQNIHDQMKVWKKKTQSMVGGDGDYVTDTDVPDDLVSFIDTQIDEMNRHLSNYKSEIETLKGQSDQNGKSRQDEIQLLKQQIKEKEQKYKMMEESIQKWKRQRDNLGKPSNNQNISIDIDKEIKDLYDHLDGYRTEIQDLKQKITNASKAQGNTDILNKQLQNQIKLYQDLKFQINEWTKKQQKKPPTADNNDVDDDQDLMKFINSQIQQMNNHMNGYVQKINEKSRQLDNLSKKSNQGDVAMKKEIQSLNEQLSEQIKRYNSLDAQIKGWKSQIKSQRPSPGNNGSSPQNDNNNIDIAKFLDSQIVTMSNQLDKTNKIIHQKDSQIQQLNAKLADATLQLKNKRQQELQERKKIQQFQKSFLKL
jgi:chromosome segregation ATPase